MAPSNAALSGVGNETVTTISSPVIVMRLT